MRHVWNTGASYTINGQRIAAEMLPDNSVRFYDVDRGIGGIIDPPKIETIKTKDQLREYVEFMYLRNWYKSSWSVDWASEIDWGSVVPR